MNSVSAVAFDFGGPVLRTPFELVPSFERRHGLAPGTYAWFGPFAPDADELWQRMQAKEITERDYWLARAGEVAAITGGASHRDMFMEFFSTPQAETIRPEAEAFADEVRARGLRTAVLTNDMAHFHTREWIDSVDFLAKVDLIVDGSVTGALKPSPRAYDILVGRLGLHPHEVLMIDDQPANIEGARTAGLQTCWFDVTDPQGSYERAREYVIEPAVVGEE